MIIQNTGSVAGAEVLQLYVSPPKDEITHIKRPIRELKGFEKTFLEPREEKKIVMQLDRLSTSCWDEKRKSWVSQAGEYEVILVAGENVLKGKFEVSKTTFWNGL